MKLLGITRRISGSNRWPQSLVLQIIAYAKVDDRFYDHLCKFTWLMDPRGYPRRTLEKVSIYLHREVLELAGTTVPEEVHHIDHDVLNAQLENLCPVSVRQNHAHGVKQRKNPTSPYKGVTRGSLNRKKQWKVTVGGKFLGYYVDAQSAAVVADLEMICLYGEFALTNAKLGLI